MLGMREHKHRTGWSVQPPPGSTLLIWCWHQEIRWGETSRLCHCGTVPAPRSRALSHLDGMVLVEAPLPFPTVTSATCSLTRRAPAAQAGAQMGREKPGLLALQPCSQPQCLCPERSSVRRCWLLSLCHSLEPWSPAHLVIQWGRCSSPKPVILHMVCHSQERQRTWKVCLGTNTGLLRPSQPPQRPSSSAFTTLFCFFLPPAYT